MNSQSIILALLCHTKLATSFLSPTLSGNFASVDVPNVRPFSSLESTKSSLRFYFGDEEFEPQDDAFLANGSPYLRHVSNLRGGSNTNDKKDDGLSLNTLSVSELKRILNDRRIDFRDCLEKKDLIDRILSSPRASSSYSASRPSDLLSQDENRVINTFARSSPSVAHIQTVSQQQRIQRSGFSLKGTEVPTGAGSGFLWDDKGHIVTNYHVIAPAMNKGHLIKVKLQGMPALSATIVGVEPEKDLAVLKISARNLPMPIDIGCSHDLMVGQNVLAIGNPFGLDYTLTSGIVSALGRDVDGIGGRPIKGCIQSDAAINPG
eukprot:scaffold1223_cov200-Alexandrium_tamarense.AAC.15